MRTLVLALAASSLALSGCGKKEATGNTSGLDEALSARDFATSDATAIDAATGADANMAADVDINAYENRVGDDGDRAASGPSRTRPRANVESNGTADSNAAAPEPVDEPAETNIL
jgi:hypothetical protein